MSALGGVSVCLGNINPGHLHIHTVQSILDCIMTQTIDRIILKKAGPYLDAERNKVVMSFLHGTECDVLIFVDSDIIFTPEHVETIACYVASAPQPTIAGGLYLNGTGDGSIKPVAYDLLTTDDGHLIPPDPFTNVDYDINTDPPTPLQCAAIGTGFMALTREVLESFPESGAPTRWFNEPNVDGIHLGEDLAFCLRARSMGYPVFVHRGVRLKHVKDLILDPDLAAKD